MIRFINLTGQIFIDDPEVNFAWYDTVTSEFMEFNSSQDWNTWKEFEQDLTIYLKEKRSTLYVSEDNEWYKQREDKVVSRFKQLYPPTVLFMEGYKEPEEFKTSQTNSDPSSKE